MDVLIFGIVPITCIPLYQIMTCCFLAFNYPYLASDKILV